jgi:hypothetical protein
MGIVEMIREASIECVVPSFTNSEESYTVRYACTPVPWCSCPDFHYRGLDKVTCKHILYIRRLVKALAKVQRNARLEVRSMGTHPTARGRSTIEEAARTLAENFSTDPLQT